MPGALIVQSIQTTAGPDNLIGPVTIGPNGTGPVLTGTAGAMSASGVWTFTGGFGSGTISDAGSFNFTGASSVITGLTGSTAVGAPWLKIASGTVAANTASFTFSSIPQTFKHLVMIVKMRNNSVSGDGTATIQFNGVSTANYDYEMIQAGTGTTLAATNPTSQTASTIGTSQGLAFSGAALGHSITFMPYYTSSVQFCTHYTIQIAGDGTSMKNQIIGGMLHIGTGPITSITLASNNDTLSSECEFTLYGIP